MVSNGSGMRRFGEAWVGIGRPGDKEMSAYSAGSYQVNRTEQEFETGCASAVADANRTSELDATISA